MGTRNGVTNFLSSSFDFFHNCTQFINLRLSFSLSFSLKMFRSDFTHYSPPEKHQSSDKVHNDNVFSCKSHHSSAHHIEWLPVLPRSFAFNTLSALCDLKQQEEEHCSKFWRNGNWFFSWLINIVVSMTMEFLFSTWRWYRFNNVLTVGSLHVNQENELHQIPLRKKVWIENISWKTTTVRILRWLTFNWMFTTKLDMIVTIHDWNEKEQETTGGVKNNPTSSCLPTRPLPKISPHLVSLYDLVNSTVHVLLEPLIRSHISEQRINLRTIKQFGVFRILWWKSMYRESS